MSQYNLDSAKLAKELCTQDHVGDRSYIDIFIPGTEPTLACDKHGQIR